jgi:hypothetical protein
MVFSLSAVLRLIDHVLKKLIAWVKSACSFETNYTPRKGCVRNRETNESLFPMRGTLNKESLHVQFFRLDSIRNLLETNGFEIKAIVNSVFLYGPITRYFLSNLRFLKLRELNHWLTDKIPHRLASGWIVVAEKK